MSSELTKQEQRKAKGKGNRMVIEETDGESDEEEGVEEIKIKASVDHSVFSSAKTLTEPHKGVQSIFHTISFTPVIYYNVM